MLRPPHLRRRGWTIPAIVMGSLLMMVETAGPERTPEHATAAQRAYEMRMLGCAEDAKALLEERIDQDPTDAAAWYELARTHMHMGLGRPAELKLHLDQALDCMQNALLHDPTNLAYHCCSARLRFFVLYRALQRDAVVARRELRGFCRANEAVLQLAPAHFGAALHLVEVYAGLPADAGGDRPRAEEYAAQLCREDEIWGARAVALLLPRSDEVLDHWTELALHHTENSDVAEELGRCYLRRDEAELAEACFRRVLRLDEQRQDLLLDLARYHLLAAVNAPEEGTVHRVQARRVLAEYLTTDPSIPLYAYALALQSHVALMDGDVQQATDLRAQAQALDPYYSRALGTPPAELFVPPGELAPSHHYLLTPF